MKGLLEFEENSSARELFGQMNITYKVANWCKLIKLDDGKMMVDAYVGDKSLQYIGDASEVFKKLEAFEAAYAYPCEIHRISYISEGVNAVYKGSYAGNSFQVNHVTECGYDEYDIVDFDDVADCDMDDECEMLIKFLNNEFILKDYYNENPID